MAALLAKYVRSETASTSESAMQALLKAEYPMTDHPLVRIGDTTTGEGFWDAFIKDSHSFQYLVDTRVVYYGPGEWIGPHRHNEDEKFRVTGGDAYVCVRAPFYGICGVQYYWLPQQYKKGDELHIDANVVHCLVAGKDGLTMHISWDDSTRSVEFVKDFPAPWDVISDDDTGSTAVASEKKADQEDIDPSVTCLTGTQYDRPVDVYYKANYVWRSKILPNVSCQQLADAGK